MISTGIDMLEISRVEQSLNNRKFINRVYGVSEQEELMAKAFPAQSAAASFAAKEAFAKALGIGIGGFALYEVEVLHEKSGKPYLYFSGNVKKLIDDKKLNFSLSITHTKDYAAAVVIAYDGESNKGGE